MKELSVLILSYNSGNYIDSCLQSIVQTYKKELKNKSLEILVVDNNSSDDTEKRVKNYIGQNSGFPIVFYQTGENLGFGNGINYGMARVSGQYALFLNPDTQVSGRGLFDMVRYMKNHERVKVVGGKMVDFNGHKELSAGKFLTVPRLLVWMGGLENILRFRFSPEKIKKVDYVSGGCMMVDTEYFRKIGGFDKDFFMYVEDMELCYRVTKGGGEVYFFPEFTVRHKGQGSSNSSFAYINIFKGIYLFHKKHSAYPSLFFVQLILRLKSILGMTAGLITLNKVKMMTYKKTLNFSA